MSAFMPGKIEHVFEYDGRGSRPAGDHHPDGFGSGRVADGYAFSTVRSLGNSSRHSPAPRTTHVRGSSAM
jgi:hypothetical protein